MMGRARSKARAGWPDNLYPNRDGFKYRHPVTRNETWMGKDKAKAFAAARQLNAMLAQAADLVAKVTGAAKTVADAIEVFRADDIPERKWGAATAAGYEIVVRRIKAGLGDRPLESLTVKDCAEWLRTDTESPRGRQTRRLVLGWVLACAVQEGWIDNNPALVTRKFSHERKRERLTVETYKAIHAVAPTWLQVAMDLSLMTLLRRDDVVNVGFADAHDKALWVIPSKTEDSTLVKLKITMTQDLAALIARARDDVVSPFIVHRLPGKARPTHMRAESRSHHTQVLPEQLTRAFAEARVAAKIESENPPTFHEIRSLGGALLRQAGWTLQQVQALMGHASETMTTVYLEGHDTPWAEVTPGLKLPA
ncbi:integrase [Xanthomonas translucens]|uniref:Integrase n=2 Tax=Xanthomonas campestris pv. translucens TaxID=343 RepID=A0A109HRY1_XANCT|nr:tyrosine-type recombinase/integrase [Xanthomonas translucens]KWV17185.1 integrase [Xanthomonas translucens]QSQ35949.1 tyrosine-type recombinase/integrase [Xanthomonas translucens pv. translucens]